MFELEELPTTDSGHVVKRHSMEWLGDLEPTSPEKFKGTVIPKPPYFTGSKFASEISCVRITGTLEFIEAVSSHLQPLLDFENEETRLEINLQRTEDRNSGELTDNYALYLSVAERG